MFTLKTHNVLDYVVGVVLLLVPAIFGFTHIDAARNVFFFAGVALIGYSLLTKYHYALWRIIPLSVHMSLDVLSGLFVMLAPWIFGYRDLLTSTQEIVHYVLAVGVFALVALTRPNSNVEVLGRGGDIFTDTHSDRDHRKVG